jgi:hypothetical protein
MPSAVPVLVAPVPDEPEIRFMHQRGGLQRLTGILSGQLLGRELPQLLIDQRPQPGGGVWVALLDGVQDARDLGHQRPLVVFCSPARADLGRLCAGNPCLQQWASRPVRTTWRAEEVSILWGVSTLLAKVTGSRGKN